MIQLLPKSVLLNMSVDEQDELVRDLGRVARKAVDATEAHVQSFPAAGKVVYAVQKRFEYMKATVDADGKPKKAQISMGISFASYWESITRANGKDGVKLNPHWLSCAVCFGTYVDSELITEADYDKNPGANLELAASISTAVGGEVTHAAVTAAAEELCDRSKDTAKKLREILAKLKEPKELKPEKALEMLRTLIAAGHLQLVIAEIGATISTLEDPEIARNAFMGMMTAHEMFAVNVDKDGKRRFPDQVLSAWAKTYREANAKPTKQQPAKPAKPETTPTPAPQPAAALAAKAA